LLPWLLPSWLQLLRVPVDSLTLPLQPQCALQQSQYRVAWPLHVPGDGGNPPVVSVVVPLVSLAVADVFPVVPLSVALLAEGLPDGSLESLADPTEVPAESPVVEEGAVAMPVLTASMSSGPPQPYAVSVATTRAEADTTTRARTGGTPGGVPRTGPMYEPFFPDPKGVKPRFRAFCVPIGL
jgi:hypothetical protein